MYILRSLIIHLSIFISLHIVNRNYSIFTQDLNRENSEQENKQLKVTFLIMKHFILMLNDIEANTKIIIIEKAAKELI